MGLSDRVSISNSNGRTNELLMNCQAKEKQEISLVFSMRVGLWPSVVGLIGVSSSGYWDE